MKIALVFPGQGSQAVAMMKPYEGLPAIRETFAEASEALGQDLWALAEQGPAEELNLTTNTQPVMLAAGVALYRAWQAAGGTAPAMLAGHSLGEYTALVVSGALGFRQAVQLVRFRAQCMQQAVPAGAGAMAAVLGLDDALIRAACAEASRDGESAEAANLNAPGQVVVAGHKAAVERAIELAKTKGAKRAMLLPMSVPSHCSLMKPAAQRLANELSGVQIGTPSIPVYQNADVAPAASAQAIKDALVRQLYQPVRWVDTIKAMLAAGATAVIECGPGKVLAGLNKRIAPEAITLSLSDSAALQAALSASR
jgi:[acyl-carrier-protein] S-malonyltransferase